MTNRCHAELGDLCPAVRAVRQICLRGIAVTRAVWQGPANLTAVTIELVLLSRVGYRGREITGSRLRGLLALLAEDLRAGCSTARLVDGAVAGRAAGAPGQGAAGPRVPRPGAARRRRHRQHARRLPARAARGPGRRLRRAAQRVRERAAVPGRRPRGGAAARRGRARAVGGRRRAGTPGTATRCPRCARHGFRPTGRWLRARALALSRLGRRAEAAGLLGELILRAPARRGGPGRAAALRGGDRGAGRGARPVRRLPARLRDELGSDPGPALQGVHRELLQADAPVVRRGVPHEPNPLLGRDDDIAAVAGLLRTSRVTSIVGPGGLGKTRLAHAVSRQAEQRVVHFVALAGVAADGDVAARSRPRSASARTAATRSAGRSATPDAAAGIVDALGPGPALLVLDNCEHVVRGAADLVRALVALSEDLRVLTTSRAPLGLSSESVYLLPELDLATTVELFRQRAQGGPARRRPARGRGAGAVRPPGRAAARRGAGRGAGAGHVGRRDRPPPRRPVRPAARRRAGRAAAAPHAARRHRLELEPARPGRAGGDARVVGVPRRLHRRRRAAPARRGDVLPVLEQLVDQSLLKVGRHRIGHPLPDAGDRARVQRRAPGGGRRDRARGRPVPGLGPRLRRRPPRLGARPATTFRGFERSGPSRTTWCRRCGTGSTARTARRSPRCRAVLGGLWMVESNFARLIALAGTRPGCCRTSGPNPTSSRSTRTSLVLGALSGFLLRGPSPARCARWSPAPAAARSAGHLRPGPRRPC